MHFLFVQRLYINVKLVVPSCIVSFTTCRTHSCMGNFTLYFLFTILIISPVCFSLTNNFHPINLPKLDFM